MRFWNVILTGLLLVCAPRVASAAHTEVKLLLSQDTARPGDTVMAGVQLRMDRDWHTYWKNAGDAGIPTEIHWHLPQGVKAGEIQWPVPQKLAEKELTTYIYTGEVVLLVPLKLGADVPSGPLAIQANVSWLECQVECVPGKSTVEATLRVGPDAKPSADARAIAEWQKRMPEPAPNLNASAQWEGPPKNESRSLMLAWQARTAVAAADFFPYPSTQYEIEAPTKVLAAKDHKVRLSKEVRKLEGGDWPRTVSGLIVEDSSAGRKAYQVDLPVLRSGTPVVAATGASRLALWWILLYGFAGGLILNVMPCVLPVIALKILGFVGQAKAEPARVRKLGLIYTAGVLTSFLVLAGLVIGVKAAGHQAGWGMQFSNPQFLVVLTVLVTLVALNLFGVFDVNPGGRLLTAAGTVASRKGAAGAFFNGVLATVLATPCTAPFLSIALGFAFAQSPGIIVLTLLSVGLGLAAPYLALSWHPGWLKLLPRPGPWMEKFKVAIGFPMLATALWLLSLLPAHYGNRSWWLGLFLLFVALAAWVFGEFVQRGQSRRGLAWAAVIALVLTGYWLVLEGQLQWRSTQHQRMTELAPRDRPAGINWQPWSPAAVAAARGQNRPILVDFTADWCLTCNGIVKPALENPLVQDKLRQLNAVALLGDYTQSPQAITDELSRYGRAGVPLILVYPKDPEKAAVVLPDPPPLSLPSHYSRTILEALTQAAD